VVAVRICIPTYNRPHLLALAIESALAQTFADFEIVIGDNGSLRETSEVIARYTDPRIRHFRHDPPMSAPENWLWLTTTATTQFVASLHDDDVWEPTFLERALPPLLADPSISMVFSNPLLIDESGMVLTEATARRTRRDGFDQIPAGRLDLDVSEGVRVAVAWNAPQPAYAAVIRRSAIVATEFPKDLHYLYDIWLSYEIARRGECLYYIPEHLTRYRLWPGSISNTIGIVDAEDAFFARVLAENPTLRPDVRRGIRRRWSEIRLLRATTLMGDPAQKSASRREYLASASGLHGIRRIVAAAAGRSDAAWRAVGFARRWRDTRGGHWLVPPLVAWAGIVVAMLLRR
jgi:glycosyltransferase involved in cell wall biosynthesis